VIFCGGRGMRLNEETEFKPKPLVEIGGIPILHHILGIYERQGFKDFVLCLGYKGNAIKEYFLNLREMSNNFILDMNDYGRNFLNENIDLNGKIAFVDTGANSMTGARISRIKEQIGEDEDFFLTYGDGVSDVDLKELYEFHKASGKIITVTAVKPVYQFGLIKEKEGGSVEFDEKPEMKDDIVSGGFMVCNRKLFDYLSSDAGCILEQEPMRQLAREGNLGIYKHEGFWHCMDTQRHVNELNQHWKNGSPWIRKD
jgi:glucose-1-phosphate cytidylyltransferase